MLFFGDKNNKIFETKELSMHKSMIVFVVFLTICLSCKKNEDRSDHGPEITSLPPKNDFFIPEDRDIIDVLSKFPEGSLSENERNALLSLIKWGDIGSAIDHPRRLKEINIQYNSKITDNDIQFLRKFPNLETLYLAKCPGITDKGMSILEFLPQLRILSLSDTSVTEASVPLIAKLEHLENLYLGIFPLNTQSIDHTESPWKDQPVCFTDNSLNYLKNSSIKHLWFMSPTNISDNGMQYICSMQNLEKIMIMSDLITEEGIEKLLPSFSDKLNEINISSSSPISDHVLPKIINFNNKRVILYGLKK